MLHNPNYKLTIVDFYHRICSLLYHKNNHNYVCLDHPTTISLLSKSTQKGLFPAGKREKRKAANYV